MAELIYPAVDPSHRGGPTLVLDHPTLVALPPVPPIEPDPGDQDAPPPTPVTLPPQYDLWGRVAGKVAPFPTVSVDEYTVAALGPDTPYEHRIYVAGTDPGWGLLGASTDADGCPRYAEIVDAIQWELWCDGVLVAEGRCDGEVEAGPMVGLSIKGGGAIFRDRYLGDGGLEDLLDGVGSFPSTSLAGWSFDSGVQYRWNTSDPYDGVRALEVRGSGWIRTPFGRWRPGSTGVNVQVTSTLMARLSEEPGPIDGIVLHTEVYDSTGARRTADWTDRHAQSTDPDIVDEWQAVDAPGLFPRLSENFRCRTAILVNDSDWVRLDRIRQVQRLMTGSLSPVSLETLLSRVLGRAQTEACGGDLGVTLQVHTPSGASDAMWWEHADDPMVGDALSSICVRSDGPDAWFTPDRVLRVSKRAGLDRGDLVLNLDTVISARLAPDPGARYLEARARVGSTGGPTRQMIGANRREAGVIARRAHDLAPTELTFRAAEAWTDGWAKYLAMWHLAVEAVCTDGYGARFGIGDRIWVELAVEGLAVDGRLRVVRITRQPAAHTRTLTLTVDDEGI